MSYFNFCYLFLQQEIQFWLAMGNRIVFRGCLIHINLQDASHFDSLIVSNTFLCIFFSSFGWQRLHSWTHSCFLLVYLYQCQAGRADLFLYFQIKCSSFLQKLCLFVLVQLIRSAMHVQQLITVQFIATLNCSYHFSV